MRTFKQWLQGFRCKHTYRRTRQFYGDIIIHMNARSEWECVHCKKVIYSQSLYSRV